MIYSYLLINLLTLAGPMARSFEPRIQFWRRWRALFPAIGLTMAFFIVWDVLYTHWGVWGFTSDYLLGLRLINLPLEEWLFFITVPYACLFIYEVLNHFIKRDPLRSVAKPLGWVLVGGGLVLVVAFWGHAYTMAAAGVMVTLLLLEMLVLRGEWLGRFFLAFVVSLVPFLIVNGILTGAITARPIVWYNDAENLGLRLATIPLDDFIYGLDLMLMNVMWYERLRTRAAI
ncbi:MAG: lycopene cyclase domain-containing protein [Bacteroidia bacterium]